MHESLAIMESVETVSYRCNILRLRNKLRHYAGPLPQEKLTPEFLEMVQEAQYEPDKLAVLEICASLHVYTENLLLDLQKVSHWFVSCFFWMITMMMTILIMEITKIS